MGSILFSIKQPGALQTPHAYTLAGALDLSLGSCSFFFSPFFFSSGFVWPCPSRMLLHNSWSVRSKSKSFWSQQVTQKSPRHFSSPWRKCIRSYMPNKRMFSASKQTPLVWGKLPYWSLSVVWQQCVTITDQKLSRGVWPGFFFPFPLTFQCCFT